jgi:hypothetical protein
MKTKSLMFAVVAVLLSAFAVAQSTPISTNLLSVTLNGPITKMEMPTKGGTSNNVLFQSGKADVAQALSIRTLTLGIEVNQTSLDVYAADALKGGKTQDDRQYASIQGHISVYVNAHYTDDGGFLTRRRALAIILNQRTVILILQEAEASNDDGGVKDWTALTDSLVINEKTCWLPEGCN